VLATIRVSSAFSMLVVDAITERAVSLYEGNGFVRLRESMRLVLPMQTIEKLKGAS
jgi:hypothetical protein